MIDITRELAPGHPTWPGDTPLTLELVSRIADGDSVNVMCLRSSTHCGTHLDAPFHYDPTGERLGAIELERLVGEALLVRASGRDPLGPELIEPLARLPERLLLATGQPDRWPAFPLFTPLTPELIHAAADRGVRLIGTDAPSVDAVDSKDLPVHRACAERDVLIVEGLALDEVDEGAYRLICLPLRLVTADASPVRAFLEAVTS